MQESIREAKLNMLVEIVADAEELKARTGSLDVTTAEVCQAQADAARDVLDASGSVAAVNRVSLPSERV